MTRIPLPATSAPVTESSSRIIELTTGVQTAKATYSTIYNEDDTSAADRAARIKAIALGKTTPPPRQTKEQRLEDARNNVIDLQDALAFQQEKHALLLKKEEQEVRASLQSPVDAEVKKFAPALVQVLESLRVLEQVENDLRARGFGFFGVPIKVDTSLVFKESAFSRTSDLAILIRELAQHGYVKLPSELR
jgi:hypothetical protein